jgi:hypothetical protein
MASPFLNRKRVYPKLQQAAIDPQKVHWVIRLFFAMSLRIMQR